MTRDEALAIVREYVKNENLIKHMLCVEAAMRFYAERLDGCLLHGAEYAGIDVRLDPTQRLQSPSVADRHAYSPPGHVRHLGE